MAVKSREDGQTSTIKGGKDADDSDLVDEHVCLM